MPILNGRHDSIRSGGTNPAARAGRDLLRILGVGLALAALPGCGGKKMTATDTTPPAAVSDLEVTARTPTSLTLAWTAPGDDGSTGRATAYDVRFAVFPLNAANFSTGVAAAGLPAPHAAGTRETMALTGLTPATRYYAALRTTDDAGNAAAVSNVATAETDPNPREPRVFHATPDGSGSDCGSLQACLNAAADGDTVELAGGPNGAPGFYTTPSDTLVNDGMGNLVLALMVAKSGVVIRAAAGAIVRVDGAGDRVGLSIPEGIADVTLRGIRFDNCGVGVRIAGGTHHIDDCEFLTGLHGLVADGADLDVTNTQFSEYAAEAVILRNCGGLFDGCEFWGNNYSIFTAQGRNITFDRTILAFMCYTGIRVEEGGTATLRRITITGAGMVPEDSSAVVVAGGASAVIDRCVVSGNRGFGIHCRAGGSVQVTCSSFFGNSAGNFEGCASPIGMNGNIDVDPLFCDPASLDFHLQPASPARNATCGVMGAYGDAPCDPQTSRVFKRRPQ